MVGINLGDVIAEGERIYGDGVNIAARLEGLAEAGGICIAGTVYDQVKTKLALRYEDLGAQAVKNITEPVRVYRVQLEPGPAAPAVREQAERAAVGTGGVRPEQGGAARRVLTLSWRQGALALLGLLLILGGMVAMWSRYFAETTPRLVLPNKPSIAVLPFANLSGDPAQDYFSDGITEVLITDLSKVVDLFVIARHSVFTYKGKAVEVGKVGRELGVQYVLEGSVLKAADKVRITAQLVDAPTAYHLWSERYDRDLQDMSALQDEIAQKILLGLRVKLTPAEQARFRRAPTSNLEAYDFFLRGRESYWRWTQEANAQARQMFEKAIALDPQYAAAYAGLRATQLDDWVYWTPWQSSLDQILALAQQTVEPDDSLPLAHSVLGSVYLWKQQPEQAIGAAQRALRLDPNFADGQLALAEILNFAGQPEKAMGWVEKAIHLNPQHRGWLGWTYQLLGRYEKALAPLQQVLPYAPNHPGLHTLLAISYSELGRQEEARAEAAALLRLNPHYSVEVDRQRLPYKEPIRAGAGSLAQGGAAVRATTWLDTCWLPCGGYGPHATVATVRKGSPDQPGIIPQRVTARHPGRPWGDPRRPLY